MDPVVRKKIEQYYKPHNEELYKLIGMNFNWE